MSLATDIALPGAALTPEALRRVRRALTALGVLSTGSMVGVAFSLYLVNHWPLLLIALSPIGRHLVLVAPIVDPIAFLFVAVGRRMLFYRASYGLGSALGVAGIAWIEQRASYFAYLARFVRWLERLFARAPRLVVLVMSGPTICALAGISGMRQAVFLPLAATSLLVRMLAILGFAELVREPIEAALAWIDAYWKPGTALMVVGVLIFQWVRIRRARRPKGAVTDV